MAGYLLAAAPLAASTLAGIGVWRDKRAEKARIAQGGAVPLDLFDRQQAVRQVPQLCDTLRQSRPGDGKGIVKTGFKISAGLGIGAGVILGTVGLIGGGPVGGLLGVAIGAGIFAAGMGVTVGLGLCKRSYDRYHTRHDNAGEFAALERQYDGLRRLADKTPGEKVALRQASKEMWRLNPANWLLQGVGYFFLGGLMFPAFLGGGNPAVGAAAPTGVRDGERGGLDHRGALV